MIFPTDHRERVEKQQKSRLYKAMLDQQIRENHLIKDRKSLRIKTQPLQSLSYNQSRHHYVKQLPHQSTFLPIISSTTKNTNLIDHEYKYIPTKDSTPNNQHRRHVSNIFGSRTYKRHNHSPYNHSSTNKQQMASDLQLEKCLQECDDLINGIGKSFIKIHKHFGNGRRNKSISSPVGLIDRAEKESKSINSHNYNRDKDLTRNYQVREQGNVRKFNNHGFRVEEDIGRNQMMNYNLTKAKEKQILHISMPNEMRGGLINSHKMSSPMCLQKSGLKTKRKSSNSDRNSLTLKNPFSINTRDYDTINSDDHNQFVQNIDLSRSLSHNFQDYEISIQLSKNLNQKQCQKQQIQLQMKNRDKSIIQNLRKAKKRGSILFKKIQMFKRHRETIQTQYKSNYKELQKTDINQKLIKPQNHPLDQNNELQKQISRMQNLKQVSQSNNIKHSQQQIPLNEKYVVSQNYKISPQQKNSKDVPNQRNQ